MGLLKRFIRRDLADLHQSRRAHPRHRRARPRRCRAAGADRRGRGADRRQQGAQPHHRLQLRLAGGDRQGRAAAGRRVAARRASQPRDITPERARRGTRHARHSRSRSCSSAPAASCGCRTSCCGRPPMPNSCSSMPTGPTSAASCSSSAINESRRRTAGSAGFATNERMSLTSGRHGRLQWNTHCAGKRNAGAHLADLVARLVSGARAGGLGAFALAGPAFGAVVTCWCSRSR